MPKQPNINKRPAADTVDEQECKHREHDVHEAHEHGLHEGRIGAGTGAFEYHDGVRQHRVDAGDLLQDADQQADDEHAAQRRTQDLRERGLRALRFVLERYEHRFELRIGAFAAGESREHAARRGQPGPCIASQRGLSGTTNNAKK